MNKNRNTNSVSNAQLEIERLKAELAALKSEKENKSVYQEDVFEPDIDIPDSAQIRVINLFPGRLILTTKKYGGGGAEYKFMQTGEIKKITYAHIRDILEVHSNFLQKGVFAILDKRVIKNHGLESVYDSILTKEKIDIVLSGKSDEAISLYQSANESQQSLIVTMIIDKLRKDPEGMDYSVVDRLSRVSGIRLSEKADIARGYIEAIEEENREKMEAK